MHVLSLKVNIYDESTVMHEYSTARQIIVVVIGVKFQMLIAVTLVNEIHCLSVKNA